ncbi:hypothetical protein [Flavobacterium sp. NRK1]|uniref:hypothetical protein n=1 Tax=Flavobacterium sp. NRK1 TaxID=2954929 RepID=UPI0020930D7D|nr:hypothetical protein [Flavobacterium sp. NRK1]MCO6146659.1 hypothetical protein [Flavobacterium sp. NRK1]
MKSIAIAFLTGLGISFIGSVPVGYLNIIAFDVYSMRGIVKLCYFLLGIITVECLIIYFIFKFAEKINSSIRLTKSLEIASLLFLIILTVFSFFTKNETTTTAAIPYLTENIFFSGILLNSVNFLQFPFWSGWSIYAVNNKIIEKHNYTKGMFIWGAGIGTMAGMLAFVLLLSRFSVYFTGIINYIIACVFLLLTLFQAFKFYRKYAIVTK